MIQSTVTNQFQITIPVAIRNQFGIKAGDKLLFDPKSNQITITKITQATQTKGALSHYTSNATYTPGDENKLWQTRAKIK